MTQPPYSETLEIMTRSTQRELHARVTKQLTDAVEESATLPNPYDTSAVEGELIFPRSVAGERVSCVLGPDQQRIYVSQPSDRMYATLPEVGITISPDWIWGIHFEINPPDSDSNRPQIYCLPHTDRYTGLRSFELTYEQFLALATDGGIYEQEPTLPGPVDRLRAFGRSIRRALS